MLSDTQRALLAARLRRGRPDAVARSPAPGVLVRLSDGVGQRPLFIAHAIGGTVYGYTALASELAGTFAVYGIEAAGLRDPSTAGLPLPDVVARYVDAIVDVQPAGPYQLAGWSIGGLLAYEIICRLEERGGAATLLVTLDAPFALPDDIVPAEPVLASQFVADAARTLGLVHVDPPEPGSSRVADQLEWLAAQMGTASADPELLYAELHRRFDVFTINKRLMSGYRPSAVIHTDALVVGAQDSPNADAQPEWRHVIDGQVSLVSLDCDHHALLHPPRVQEVAAMILAFAGASS